MFKNKNILVLGLARSGYEVSKLLKNKTNSKIDLFASSDQDKEQLKELKQIGINIIVKDKIEEYLGDDYMKNIDLIIKNPGIIIKHPCLLYANKNNIPVINEIEVAYHFFPKNVKIIGITGSNGKTTTASLVYEMLKTKKVHLGGNIGIPLSRMLDDIKENDYLVIEISDRQLLNLKDFKTNISILTNLSETHLDFHGSYKNYKEAKMRIFNHHTKDNIAILNKDDSEIIKLTKNILSSKLYFSSKTKTDIYIKDNIIYYKDEFIINIKDIKIKGSHNYENIMAAILVAKEFNISNEIIKEVLINFKGVEHRIEYINNILDREFYNDSKATNIESTITALKSFDKPVILILGGLDRNHSFDSLKDYLNKIKIIVCYGETKNRIKNFCNTYNKECIVVTNLSEATKISFKLSEKKDIILLSPACASWDQYKSFEDRGIEFKNIVNNLGGNSE